MSNYFSGLSSLFILVLILRERTGVDTIARGGKNPLYSPGSSCHIALPCHGSNRLSPYLTALTPCVLLQGVGL